MILLIVDTDELPAQTCPTHPTQWARKLTNSSYNWAFDWSTISSARYTDGTPISVSTVEIAINDAATAWTDAANQAGTRITVTQIQPPTNYAAAEIKVKFGSVPGEPCAETHQTIITLDSETQWKPPGGSTGADLKTIVLHEVGHVFLGSGHYDNDPTSIMSSIPCGPTPRGLNSCDRQITLDFYNPKYNVTVKNDFGGGNVKVDGVTHTNIPAAGKVFTWRASTFPHTLEALDGQSFGGYVRRYQDWTLPDQSTNPTNPRSVPIPSSSSVTYTANFAREFNITFKNSFSGGTIKVRGNVQNSPYTTQVTERNPSETITAEAISGQVYTSIKYTFTNWTKNGNAVSTSAQTDFTPNDHTTYIANFTGKPEPVTITSSSGQVGTPVRIVWQEHPHPNVSQYQVWRKARHNGVWRGPDLLTTLNRGTTSFTDPDYLFTAGYTHDLLNYDIRAYYSTDGSYADPQWIVTYGQLYRVLAESQTQRPRPTEYAISNYPNPFNPTTYISFQLVETGRVTLSIYNVRGQRVAQFVDNELPGGYYGLIWDGKDTNGHSLASGNYFARLTIDPQTGGQTRVLTQRMLLMK